MRTMIFGVLCSVMLLGTGFAESGSPALGSIRGDIFTKGVNGEPAVLPGAHIVLRGPITKETVSDAQGAFAVDGLPPGSYHIEANAPGLVATVPVEVTSVPSFRVAIEMNVATVTDTVNVTATEAPVAEESAQQSTISQSVVEQAPNQEEKIES